MQQRVVSFGMTGDRVCGSIQDLLTAGSWGSWVQGEQKVLFKEFKRFSVTHAFRFIAAAGLTLLLTHTASAQWINYKTPGLPRGADGKVIMTAPRPMTADGKPDLTGLWRLEAKTNPGTLIEAAGPQPWIVDAAKRFMHELGRDDTGVHCLPDGPRALHSAAFAKFVQAPSLITVLYESMDFRQLFLDGRPLLTDPNPSWLGYSVGRWDGNTLVVTTNGYNDRTLIDGEGHRHTEALRVTERFTRRDLGHMDIQVTFEDPKAYAKPITIPVEATLQPDTELIEYICAENERSRPHLVGTADDDKKQQVTISGEVLARYAGTYRFPPFFPGDKPLDVTITPKDGVLSVAIERGPTLVAIPTSQTKFLAQGVAVEFLAPDTKGIVNEVVVTIVEGEFKGVRVK